MVSSTAVIWFSVSVPVLSELIADVDPSVSVDRSRFTIAFDLASSCVPSDRMVVTTAGRPVGIADTANATAAVNTTANSLPRARLMTTEASSAMPAITRIWLVSLLSWRVSGVSASFSLCSMPEIRPTSVPMPVAVTSSSPAPRVTLVFMYAMSERSPSAVSAAATAATSLATGRLSPVSADSSISSVAARSSRPSAGTTSPASICTTSPGTSSSAGISTRVPARRTFALMIIIFWRASIAAAALPSWCRPRAALSRVRAISRMPVPHCFSG
jgi:hypothetical protein